MASTEREDKELIQDSRHLEGDSTSLKAATLARTLATPITRHHAEDVPVQEDSALTAARLARGGWRGERKERTWQPSKPPPSLPSSGVSPPPPSSQPSPRQPNGRLYQKDNCAGETSCPVLAPVQDREYRRSFRPPPQLPIVFSKPDASDCTADPDGQRGQTVRSDRPPSSQLSPTTPQSPHTIKMLTHRLVLQVTLEPNRGQANGSQFLSRDTAVQGETSRDTKTGRDGETANQTVKDADRQTGVLLIRRQAGGCRSSWRQFRRVRCSMLPAIAEI